MNMIPMITGTEVTFWVCAVLAILGAVGLVAFRKPVYSALCLALVMVSLAVIYASLGAPFLFAVQIIVYTGAVLMLFLFVVMLVGVDTDESITGTIKGHLPLVVLAGVGVLGLLVLAVVQGVVAAPVGVDAVNDAAGGNVQGLASLIFSRYVIAFEATAALLITAAVAAMVLAHPERLRPKATQTDKAAERLSAYVEGGVHPGPKPNSGVFARHNSIATPALLPDGSVADESVMEVLRTRVAIASPEDLWAPHDETLMAIDSSNEPDISDIEQPDESPEITAAPVETALPQLASDAPAEPAVPVETAEAEPAEAEPAEAEPAEAGYTPADETKEKTND